MSYTVLAVLSVPSAVIADRWVLRTCLTSTGSWWLAYAIIVVFQLVTNGWLTARGIVRYSGAAILGGERIAFVGDGRLFYAPVEDLGFGFALVLLSCAMWVWLGPRDRGDRSPRIRPSH